MLNDEGGLRPYMKESAIRPRTMPMMSIGWLFPPRTPKKMNVQTAPADSTDGVDQPAVETVGDGAGQRNHEQLEGGT